MTTPVRSPLFSPVRWVGPLAFLSGQIGLKDNELVSSDLGDQLRQTVANIETILKDNRLSLASVVDVTVFLIDMGEYDTFNDIYRELFPEPRPTRTTVCVAQLPLGARVELKVIATAP